jgi:putative FmdB family regulatory protein
MPLYEYECEACQQRFEVIQKFSDPAPETCARCGKGPIRRVISTPAIQFKGSGWYITDYAGGRSSAASSTTASDAGDAKAKSDGAKADGGKSDAGKSDGGKSSGDSGAKSDSGSAASSSTSSTAKD